MAHTQLYQQVLNLKKENYKLREELKVQIDLKYKLFDENIKLKESLQERYTFEEESEEESEDETHELKKELEVVKQERDKLKREKEIQKLGGLKLCYKD